MADTPVKDAVQANPVTSVAAVGALVAAVAHFVGWDAETQLVIVQGALGAALLFRGALAYFKPKPPLVPPQ